MTEIYKHLGTDYPKFYKMDHLSRLAFIASELLLRDTGTLSHYQPQDMSIVVSTRHSSMDTDLRYWNTVATAASPSLFVYTLPNVMIGEICIRNGIKGENTCFVSDTFDAAVQTGYINGLIAGGNAELCISGWADHLAETSEAFFMLVEKKPSSLGWHDIQTVQKLYDSTWKN
jgi:3-oxoacyl-(acyl-carrier-protein) synthase